MDISDGLVGDLEKLAKVSNVGITIELATIPLSAELIFMFDSSAIELALNGGEDYELVFIAPESVVNNLPEDALNQITVIGHVTSDQLDGGNVVVVDSNGDNYEPIRKGWDHLNG
jgi:thiamine-monophosphate kinase